MIGFLRLKEIRRFREMTGHSIEEAIDAVVRLGRRDSALGILGELSNDDLDKLLAGDDAFEKADPLLSHLITKARDAGNKLAGDIREHITDELTKGSWGDDGNYRELESIFWYICHCRYYPAFALEEWENLSVNQTQEMGLDAIKKMGALPAVEKQVEDVVEDDGNES